MRWNPSQPPSMNPDEEEVAPTRALHGGRRRRGATNAQASHAARASSPGAYPGKVGSGFPKTICALKKVRACPDFNGTGHALETLCGDAELQPPVAAVHIPAGSQRPDLIA